MRRVAYFPHERPGDALVDVGQLPALRRVYSPCEVAAFCSAANRELFGCLAWCDTVEAYETERAWTAEETASFGAFEAVFSTRHDWDAFERTRALAAKTRYGYETGEVPEAACKEGYTAYLPLSTWDDESLRWHTSVCEQGAALVRLVEPGFHIDFPMLGTGISGRMNQRHGRGRGGSRGKRCCSCRGRGRRRNDGRWSGFWSWLGWRGAGDSRRCSKSVRASGRWGKKL